MVESKPFSTCQLGDLRDYFKTRVKKPRWRKEFRHVDGQESTVDIGPVRLGWVRECYRHWTFGSRCRFASWNWLRPEEPHFTVQDIPSLKKASGLDHLETAAFCAAIEEDCKEILRQHPRLAMWVRKRLSFLEFCTYRHARLPSELHENAMRLRHALMEAVGRLAIDPTMAVDWAQRIAQTALHSAAQAARVILGKAGCPISANLMLPVPMQDRDGPRIRFSPIAEENARRASTLWADPRITAKKCLVILAETEGSPHMGFWVPVLQSDANGADIHGAPAAYRLHQGAAVFKDDLPHLDQFSPDLTGRWHSYLRQHLRERMFVSLPFFLPNPGGLEPAAILNVNADPQLDDGWFRAYHQPWLEVARAEVAPFVEIAFYGTVLKIQALADEYRDMIPSRPDSWPLIQRPRELPPARRAAHETGE